MNTVIEEIKLLVPVLAEEYKLSYLAVFGSVLRKNFCKDSDIDLLVCFEGNYDKGAFHQYFDCKEFLEKALGRSVDLVCYNAIRNPIFKEDVNESKLELYAA